MGNWQMAKPVISGQHSTVTHAQTFSPQRTRRTHKANQDPEPQRTQRNMEGESTQAGKTRESSPGMNGVSAMISGMNLGGGGRPWGGIGRAGNRVIEKARPFLPQRTQRNAEAEPRVSAEGAGRRRDPTPTRQGRPV